MPNLARSRRTRRCRVQSALVSHWPGLAALEFFEQGNSVEPGIDLQQWDDLAVPDRAQWVFSGAPVSCGTMGRRALRDFNTPGASLADAGFGS